MNQIRDMENYKQNISQINSCLIIMQNAVNNDTDEISNTNLYENLQVVILKINDSVYETEKMRNYVFENENYERLKLEQIELRDCLIILRIALEQDFNNEINSDIIDSFLNIMIKKSKQTVLYSQNIKFLKLPKNS